MTLRSLPSVDRLAAQLPLSVPRSIAVNFARQAIDEARSALAEEATSAVDPVDRALALADDWVRRRPTGVINATGVLLHTNLGRAPVHPDAVRAAQVATSGYTNLEMEMGAAIRGSRLGHLVSQLTKITGAASALIVNNNAASLLLTLSALADRAPVPVSRGEMIEIGGSYRLPELMSASGAEMVEIGTTNRTRIGDYEAAISEHTETAFLLKIHPSNYRVSGFTEDASIAELAELGRSRDLPVVFDVGSGLIDERVPWVPGAPPEWLRKEPGVIQSLASGADLVMFSGDKLLGGPQAGIIVGSKELIDRLRKHPMARAMRVDGATIGMLSATLDHYLNGTAGDLPFWQMATAERAALRARADAIVHRAGIDPKVVVESEATIGAGSVPGATIKSIAIEIDTDVDARFTALLSLSRPIVGRRLAGRLLLDLRTILPDEDPTVAEALTSIWR